MTFVSYAQNHEDVLLFRALGHIHNGVYVDVGASHPEEDSVTKAFYDRGWTGVNIEPSPKTFALLDRARIYDLNLNIAISDTSDEVIFYDAPQSGLSTLTPGGGEMLEKAGLKPDLILLKTERLEIILDLHRVSVIHFLKIDVEGAEKSVIKGAGLGRHRPWIIVVEATAPNSNTPNHFDWEYLICEANYHFVYFDGVNRYYVSNEHSELDASFNVPVNVLDCYIRLSEYRLKRHARRLEVDRQFLEQKVSALATAASSAQVAHANALAIIENIKNKWAPQRVAAKVLRLVRLAASKARAGLTVSVRGCYQFMSRFPDILAFLSGRLEKFPYLKMQLRRMVRDFEYVSAPGISSLKTETQSELSALLQRVEHARLERRT